LQYVEAQLAEINNRQNTNYKPSTAVLNAADYGVPQLRKRLFIIAARDGTHFKFPEATHVSPAATAGATKKSTHRTAWDAIGSIRPPQSEDLEVRGKWANLLASIPEGQNYLWHTERGGGEPLFGWRRRYWSVLLKLAKDMPSWTIQAQPGPATGPFHWLNRRLNAQEMARLQTFPKDIVFAGSYADVQRQLGNAVPSLLAEVLAREISSQLLHRAATGKLQFAISRSRTPTPRRERVKCVPEQYLELRGSHAAHPGTGKGYRATSRVGLIDVYAEEVL
jgi:DNA (cytosine-5)-methyltransferase 1